MAEQTYDHFQPERFDLTLLANFVHQVVNPLNGVAGTLDNAVTGVLEGERKDQRLNAARAQLQQCITLIRNLAFLAQGSGGVADRENRLVVLPQVIIESAMFYQEGGSDRGVKIHLEDRQTQNAVAGHHEIIQQILMNLFDNFIKYGRKNSVVTINHWIQKGTSSAIIQIKGYSENKIEGDDIKNFCALGFRGGNARKILASGTGLGLYICNMLLDRHQGKLHIQTFANNGIEFKITLPNGVKEEDR